VLDVIVAQNKGETKHRRETVAKDPALAGIKKVIVTNTRAQSFLEAMQAGTVRMSLFAPHPQCALDFNGLLYRVIPSRPWPKFKCREKRAIKLPEHLAIVAAMVNPDQKQRFYAVAEFRRDRKLSGPPDGGPLLKILNLFVFFALFCG